MALRKFPCRARAGRCARSRASRRDGCGSIATGLCLQTREISVFKGLMDAGGRRLFAIRTETAALPLCALKIRKAAAKVIPEILSGTKMDMAAEAEVAAAAIRAKCARGKPPDATAWTREIFERKFATGAEINIWSTSSSATTSAQRTARALLRHRARYYLSAQISGRYSRVYYSYCIPIGTVATLLWVDNRNKNA